MVISPKTNDLPDFISRKAFGGFGGQKLERHHSANTRGNTGHFVGRKGRQWMPSLDPTLWQPLSQILDRGAVHTSKEVRHHHGEEAVVTGDPFLREGKTYHPNRTGVLEEG